MTPENKNVRKDIKIPYFNILKYTNRFKNISLLISIVSVFVMPASRESTWSSCHNLPFVFLFILLICCNNPDDQTKPLLGHWKSLWDKKSTFLSTDFNLTFETNNKFLIEVYGAGQTLPIIITGNYRVTHDTLMVLDKTNEPIQICNFSDTGKYIFKYQRDTILFKVISDPCEKRKRVLEIGLSKYE